MRSPGHAGEEARERTAALDTLLDILATLSRSDAGVDVRRFLAELERRRAAERAGSADGVNLLTYHRAKGLEWDAVALPALEEGILPIRQAVDDDELARRGAAPALRRHHPRATPPGDLVGRGARDARAHDPPRSRAGSSPTCGRDRSTASNGSRSSPTGSPRTRARAAPPRRRRPRPGTAIAEDDPLYSALRAWRTDRAREDGVPAYVVFHDQTLAAIAEMKPPSAAALRRVKGVGPAKIEAYGDEVLELVSRLR